MSKVLTEHEFCGMQTIGTAPLVLGWVVVGLLCVSVLVACFLVLSAICGRASKAVSCFSVPFT